MGSAGAAGVNSAQQPSNSNQTKVAESSGTDIPLSRERPEFDSPCDRSATVAQRTERQSSELGVGGSSPSCGTAGARDRLPSLHQVVQHGVREAGKRIAGTRREGMCCTT